MNSVLILEKDLMLIADQIRSRFRAENSQLRYVVDIDNPIYGKAFSWYLLFYHWPDMFRSQLHRISDLEIFYNSYYWFQVFSRLYMRVHGNDAGLEQQAFKLLEHAGEIHENVDWTLVEQMDNEATDRASKLGIDACGEGTNRE